MIKIMLLIVSIALLFMSIYCIILNKKLFNLKFTLDCLAYWIRSIDHDALNESVHDKYYLNKANEILDDIYK